MYAWGGNNNKAQPLELPQKAPEAIIPNQIVGAMGPRTAWPEASTGKGGLAGPASTDSVAFMPIQTR
jgi:hypothetical protein